MVVFGRTLFFLFNVYPGRWTAGIFIALLLALQYLGALLFPYNQHIYESTLEYLLKNQLGLLFLPMLFSVPLTYFACVMLFRKGAIHYYWEGDTLHLLRNGPLTSLRRPEIISVSSTASPVLANWMRPMQLFKIKTTKGTFWFDEALEKNYWQDSSRVSFWSLKDGIAQARRNSQFAFGNARVSSYFQDSHRSQ